VTFVIDCEGFELDYMVMLDDDYNGSTVHALPGRKAQQSTSNGGNGVWFIGEGENLKRKPLRAKEPGTLKILPRPPKMEVTAKSMVEGELYVNETVLIELDVGNGEEEDAVVDIGIRILGWPAEDERNAAPFSSSSFLVLTL
jgi:trafficking protein particle complex subunit 11